MARGFEPQIATANDLLEGDVVYFTEEGLWSRDIAEAQVAQTAEAADALFAQAGAFPNQVVGVYLIEAVLDADGRASPAHFREAFRMRGPSNYFHGKQAERRTDV